MFTSGPDTFNDIQNPTDAEFPEQDPSRGELAEAVERVTDRVENQTSEEESGDPLALWIAVGAAVLSLIAIVLAARRRA